MIDKNEMLQVFKEMLRLWELLAKSSNGLNYKARHCVQGFCYYLRINEPSNYKTYINYLKNNIHYHPESNYQLGYWFPMYYDVKFYFYLIDFKIVIENQLQPRIDHLKRTIARLENEL